MSRIISILEEMASDATLVNKANIESLLINADLNDVQKEAISSKDIELLAESLTNFTKIESVFIIPAEEDDQEQENEEDKEAKSALDITITA